MSDTVGIMTAIWVDEPFKRAIRKVASRFERLNRIPVRVIEDADLTGEFLSSPYFARYHAWRFVPRDTERIFHFDADIIPLKPLPPFPDADFAAVQDRALYADKYAECWPIFRKNKHYFNAGVFMATRKTEPLFKRMVLQQTHAVDGGWPWIYDQTMLNIEVQTAVEMGEITYASLPKQWNNLALLDEERVPGPCMLHLAGPTHMYKMYLVEHIVDHLNRLESLAEINQAQKAQARGPTTDHPK